MEWIIKIREKEKARYSDAIIIFPGMKYDSTGIQVNNHKAMLKG